LMVERVDLLEVYDKHEMFGTIWPNYHISPT